MAGRIAPSLVLVFLAAVLSQPAQGQGTTIYVDATISSASCTTYSPSTRACSGGAAAAYRTLAGAAAAANPGITVLVRAGTYAEQLSPARSGTAGQPITFRAFTSEAPAIANLSNPAIVLNNRHYIVVDGFTVRDVLGWGRFDDSNNNTIQNNTFLRATAGGTTGGLKLVRSSFNKITNNVFTDGNDSMVFQDNADRNLVVGNTFTTARHSLLSVRCSNFNVFRANSFSNANQKAIEIYDCEGTSDAPVRLNAAKRNLFDANQVIRTPSSSAPHNFNGIQHGAQQTIVRRNVFRNNDGGGVNYQYYSEESRYVYGNRLYNNTFYLNRCFAIVGQSGPSSEFSNNLVKYNVLYRNTNCSGTGGQTSIEDTSSVVLTNNAVETSAPGFVNESGFDFRLAPGSRLIDAAGALTATSGAGSGTTMTVQDASYLYTASPSLAKPATRSNSRARAHSQWCSRSTTRRIRSRSIDR